MTIVNRFATAMPTAMSAAVGYYLNAVETG